MKPGVHGYTVYVKVIFARLPNLKILEVQEIKLCERREEETETTKV